jgi:hypothetical protein
MQWQVKLLSIIRNPLPNLLIIPNNHSQQRVSETKGFGFNARMNIPTVVLLVPDR